MKNAFTLLACLLVSGLTAGAGARENPDNPVRLLRELPLPDAGVPLQASSYDRTMGNDDGFSGTYSALREIEVDGHTEFVVMEADRPGILGSIWFTGDMDLQTDRRIRFYFDGETKARIDLPVAEFFSGKVKPFVEPLVADNQASSGGFVCSMVIPWEKSIRVTTTKRQRFFHFTYRCYEALPGGMATFDPDLRILQHAADGDFQGLLRNPDTIRVDEGKARQYAKPVEVPARGSAVVAELAGPGIVTRMDLQVESEDPACLRRSLLKMFWDGEALPSVEVPLGDFFGCAFGKSEFLSVPFGSTERGFYSNWQMPFSGSARIVIDNGSPFAPMLVNASISVLEDGDAVARTEGMRFHAKWHRAETKAGEPHLLLQARGRGKYVGTFMGMQGPGYTYLEGDEIVYIDGGKEPSLLGTGTEDYFNAGWYFMNGVFSLPYHGLILKSDSVFRIAAHRLHVPDAIPFSESIRFEIEHGPGNDQPGCDYATVAYWYQTEPHLEPFAIPPAAACVPARGPNEIPWTAIGHSRDYTIASATGAVVQRRTWESLGVPERPGRQYFFPATGEGQGFTIPLSVGVPDRYELLLEYSEGAEYGAFEVLVNGETVGKPIRAHQDLFIPAMLVRKGPLKVPSGTAEITFRTLPAPDGGAYGIGLDAVVLVPASPTVERWKVLGPFDLASMEDLNQPHPAEDPVLEDFEYLGKEGKIVRWQEMAAREDGALNLDVLTLADDCLALCRARIFSPREYDTHIYLGSDDGVNVLLNGETVFRVLQDRSFNRDENVFPVHLREGWNSLLVRIGDSKWTWLLSVRVADPEGILQFEGSGE